LARGRRITWLGQAGFRIEVEETVFVVDPWISEHEDRITPSAPLELAADDVDVLIVTHEPRDHLDLPFLPSLLERSPDARVVLPAAIASHVEGIVSESRLVLVEPGTAVDLNGVELQVTPAFHGVSLDDAYGDGSAVDGRPRFVGYMLGSERRIYHAGDSIVTDELIEALETLGIDDIADTHEVEVASRDPDDQISLTNNPQDEVEPVLTFDLTGFNVLDHGGPMIWVHHRFSDCKGHIVFVPLSRSQV